LKFISTFGGFAAFLYIVNVSAEPMVRVRLFEKYDKIVISGNITVQTDQPFQGTKLTVENQGQNYTWTLEQEKGKVIDLSDFATNLEITGKNLTYNDLKLPETIRVIPLVQPGGKFSRFVVLGILELEKYLSGVLPGEMPLGWPLEALKAQLITARTYTLKQIENRKDENYDVDSTVRDQLFTYEAPLTDEKRKNLTAALESTKGMVLSDSKGEVVLANYHADCGGQTELAKNVWNFGIKGVAVSDYSCAVRSTGAWTYAISMNQLMKKIGSEVKLLGVKLAGIEPISSTTSGRVSLLSLNFADGTQKEILATRLRELIGYSLLKSTRFKTHVDGERVTFSGRGFGHGVGLCQWGAKDLAKSGKSFKEILGHYFPGLKIVSTGADALRPQSL
jgi:stage II sporulation protein D